MNFPYTQYHTILHGRRIIAMITIYTDDGTIQPNTSTRPRRPVKQTNAPTHTTTTKDDTSVTPALQTLCTQDTRSSHQTNLDPDAILSITIWNQPIVQYRMSIRSTIRNQPRYPSPAVKYALIGVYDKLIHPRKLPCLLYLFNRITRVVLSSFILLADLFTMIKIDDRYPDEWND